MNYYEYVGEIPVAARKPKKKRVVKHSADFIARSTERLLKYRRSGSTLRRVVLIDENGFYEEFDGIIHAAKRKNMLRSAVCKCAAANKRFVGGHNDHYAGEWRVYYEDDYNWLKKRKFRNF